MMNLFPEIACWNYNAPPPSMLAPDADLRTNSNALAFGSQLERFASACGVGGGGAGRARIKMVAGKTVEFQRHKKKPRA
jgi:hypothetical protein